ncbi:MAG: hypothetical protein FWC64_06050 [Treponema sp.]|nr:hypothetical protein [Treponema sp.]
MEYVSPSIEFLGDPEMADVTGGGFVFAMAGVVVGVAVLVAAGVVLAVGVVLI